MNWLQRQLFKARTGSDIRVANNGNPVDEVVIRHKDFYFGIMIDVESGEPTGDFGWSRDAGMFPATPIRDHYKTVKVYATKEKP